MFKAIFIHPDDKSRKVRGKWSNERASSVTNTYGHCRLNDSSAVVHCTSSYRFFLFQKSSSFLCFKTSFFVFNPCWNFPNRSNFYWLFFCEILRARCERKILSYRTLDTHSRSVLTSIHIILTLESSLNFEREFSQCCWLPLLLSNISRMKPGSFVVVK